ncbi:cysteine desulfurase [Chitinophaga skermanii]|uniref:cysteine desulfurase n=2 Tax=Chitinophaga skermanii TaxID=331697 RepID=A0A327Q3T8_9BACT|nr:cysteine desulfurase [Chitinophaga skermanii]
MDYNATTPCDPRVVEVMLPLFTQEFGNAASRDHLYGWQAHEQVEDARQQVAKLIGANTQQIVFTSGATEAINLGLKGIVEAFPHQPKHIITCKTEHSAVLDTCDYLTSKGVEISYLDVNDDGKIDLAVLESEIRTHTICIALMYANNETGVIHPVQAISSIAHKHGILFFCDATQAVGKIPVDVLKDGIDIMAFSAHKLYGPKGIGALFIGNGVKEKNLPFIPQQHGGHHEGGMRSGTLNTPGIVGFGKAAALCAMLMETESQQLRLLRDQLENELKANIPGLQINGAEPRLPHVSNITLPHGHAEQILLSLSQQLAASRSSACKGLLQAPSHVLTAMGITGEQAARVIRLSLGRFTTQADILQVVALLTNAVICK